MVPRRGIVSKCPNNRQTLAASDKNKNTVAEEHVFGRNQES